MQFLIWCWLEHSERRHNRWRDGFTELFNHFTRWKMRRRVCIELQSCRAWGGAPLSLPEFLKWCATFCGRYGFLNKDLIFYWKRRALFYVFTFLCICYQQFIIISVYIHTFLKMTLLLKNMLKIGLHVFSFLSRFLCLLGENCFCPIVAKFLKSFYLKSQMGLQIWKAHGLPARMDLYGQPPTTPPAYCLSDSAKYSQPSPLPKGTGCWIILCLSLWGLL